MGGEERPGFDGDAQEGARQPMRPDKAANLRIFREMIKHDVQNRPLGWRRRREFVRFAQRLDIDPFHARLLIRAVEYECGHAVPAAMAEVETGVETAYVAHTPTASPFLRFLLLLFGAIFIDALILKIIFELAR